MSSATETNDTYRSPACIAYLHKQADSKRKIIKIY